MEQVRYRVGILRSSGSVWLQEYPSLAIVIDALPDLLEKHPHVLISRQKVKENGEDGEKRDYIMKRLESLQSGQ